MRTADSCLRPAAALLAAAGVALVLVACSQAAGTTHGRERPAAAVAPSKGGGEWFAFEGGRLVAVTSPAAVSASFEPWTVASWAAGFIALGRELYVAVNGWGLVALPDSVGGAASGFRSYEERHVFGGRTINGFYADGSGLLIDLYRNTVFPTAAPQSPPVAFVRFDSAESTLVPVALPPSREGWEAVDVIHTARGAWAFAWKKSTAERTQFRYTLYEPATGNEKAIARSTFFAAYDFVGLADAPAAVRRLAGIAAAKLRGAGAGGEATVLHLELRGAPYVRTERFVDGPEQLLASGDARLVTVPVVRADGALYALLSAGRVVWVSDTASSGAQGELALPALPGGFAYTQFWTDGRLLVASWERQRFTEVGTAGLYWTLLPSSNAPLAGRTGATS